MTLRGLTDIAGRHAAYETIRQAPGNQNDWVVVASAPRPEASLLHSLGGPPLALILLGLAFAGGALALVVAQWAGDWLSARSTDDYGQRFLLTQE